MKQEVAGERVSNLLDLSSAVEAGCEARTGDEPLVNPNTAEHGEDIEQSRSYRLSRHCHPRGMNERSGFHTSRLGDEPQRGLDGRRIERGELCARSIERGEMLSHSS
jgi:hypothetical protein